jgi:glycerophosphoryl diester phosphodiesterase
MIRIYAHRGDATRGHPQNGMDAFRDAVAAGCHGIETDLRHTSDGRIVLFHDHAVRGMPVHDMTLDELRAIAGPHVSTLDDVMARDWTIDWNLEVKTREAWRLVRDLRTPFVRRSFVTSFIHDIAWDAGSLGIRSGLLVADTRKPVRRPHGGPDVIVFDWKVLDAGLASEAASSGWTLATYGTESRAEHRAAVEMGARMLITDHPERGLSIMGGSS